MTLERTPLAGDELPIALRAFFGEGVPAAKAMLLARGLAPGLSPADLVTGLYQASCSQSAAVAEAAVKSARELPEKILAGALVEALDPRVLDLFAELARNQPELLQRILLNRHTADKTFVDLARTLRHEKLLEIIGQNEERLLRAPAIIEALYLNKHTRMSTASRAVELAVRNKIVLEIAAYKEIAHALGTEPRYDDPMDQELAELAADEAFATAMAASGDPDEVDEAHGKLDDEALRKKTSMLGLTVAQKIRLALVGSSYHRSMLLTDPNRVVAMAAIKSPGVKETEVIRVTQSRSANDDVIRYVASNREWLKLYQIKANLANNPKCPLPTAMRLLPFLRLNDLRSLSRSKNIASALRTAAKGLLSKKG